MQYMGLERRTFCEASEACRPPVERLVAAQRWHPSYSDLTADVAQVLDAVYEGVRPPPTNSAPIPSKRG